MTLNGFLVVSLMIRFQRSNDLISRSQYEGKVVMGCVHWLEINLPKTCGEEHWTMEVRTKVYWLFYKRKPMKCRSIDPFLHISRSFRSTTIGVHPLDWHLLSGQICKRLVPDNCTKTISLVLGDGRIWHEKTINQSIRQFFSRQPFWMNNCDNCWLPVVSTIL